MVLNKYYRSSARNNKNTIFQRTIVLNKKIRKFDIVFMNNRLEKKKKGNILLHKFILFTDFVCRLKTMSRTSSRSTKR